MFDAETNVKCNDYCGLWNSGEEEEMNSGRSVKRSNLRIGF